MWNSQEITFVDCVTDKLPSIGDKVIFKDKAGVVVDNIDGRIHILTKGYILLPPNFSVLYIPQQIAELKSKVWLLKEGIYHEIS